jgi:hypothetical protein
MRMATRKTPDPRQFAFDFTAPTAGPELSPPVLFPKTDLAAPLSPARPSTTVHSQTHDAQDRVATSSPQGIHLVRVLPWDFHSSFPEPQPEHPLLSVELVGQPLDVADYHHKLAHRGVEILEGIDWIAQAHHLGVDPDTGAAPEHDHDLNSLRRRLDTEKAEQEEAFDVFLVEYAKTFGKAAADAFRTAMRVWHLGGNIITRQPPTAPATAQSIADGHFGFEEDGSAVNPTHEEVFEITAQLADHLRDVDDPQFRQSLLQQYKADFGESAAESLDQWAGVINRVEEDDTASLQYDPGHPWHYYHEGDAAEPIPAHKIPAAPKYELPAAPKNPRKRLEFFQQMFVDQEKQFQEDMDRYTELADKGAEALSDYDRNIAHDGNEDLAWASAIALKFNHIRYGQARMAALRAVLAMPTAGKPTRSG